MSTLKPTVEELFVLGYWTMRLCRASSSPTCLMALQQSPRHVAGSIGIHESWVVTVSFA